MLVLVFIRVFFFLLFFRLILCFTFNIFACKFSPSKWFKMIKLIFIFGRTMQRRRRRMMMRRKKRMRENGWELRMKANIKKNEKKHWTQRLSWSHDLLGWNKYPNRSWLSEVRDNSVHFCNSNTDTLVVRKQLQRQQAICIFLLSQAY